MDIVLVGAAPLEKELFPFLIELKKQGSYFIAVDGGYNHFSSLPFLPDALIGDMDSIDPLLLKNVPCEIDIYSREKDHSDFALALKKGVEEGGTSFLGFGFLGGRIDHTLSNLSELYRTPNIVLYQKEGTIRLIEKNFTFSSKKGALISFFTFEENTFISSKGLKWEMNNMPLTPLSFSLSNEAEKGEISITLTGDKKRALLFCSQF